MAGFDAAKKLQEVDDTIVPETTKGKVDRYLALRNELSDLISNKLLTHLFVGVAGHENTGKTAIILDAFSSDEEAAEKNEQLWVIDFDGGGSATASAFHSDNDRIRCWEPCSLFNALCTSLANPSNKRMKTNRFADCPCIPCACSIRVLYCSTNPSFVSRVAINSASTIFFVFSAIFHHLNRIVLLRFLHRLCVYECVACQQTLQRHSIWELFLLLLYSCLFYHTLGQ